MQFETARDLSQIDFVIAGGINEMSATTGMSIKNLLKMVNWRIAKDGERIEKRGGLLEVTHFTGTDNVDVFGFGTYYNSAGTLCYIAVTEAKIWRLITGGSWTAIHTWASTLAHPVKIIELQNRIYVLSEIENVMILSNGTKVQAGITAPTTLPTIAVSYDASLCTDDMAVITDWTDEDAGAGDSSQETFDSKSCMKLLCTGVNGDLAQRTRTIAGFGPELGIELDIYFDAMDCYQGANYFQMNAYNGRICCQVRVDKNDLYVYSGTGWVAAGMKIDLDKWHRFKFYINTKDPGEEYVSIYMDDYGYGDYFCNYKTEAYTGKIQLLAKGYTYATDVKIDNFTVGTTAGGNILGQVRYAVCYIRSGNYGGYSNPIISKIGTVAFSVAPGLNDMTVTGVYTGDKTRTFVVNIDGTGTPDTFKWSEDGGVTWNSTANILFAKCYLPYGIILNWAATTGHTATNTWTFTCTAMAVSTNHQKVTLSSIPVSSDTGPGQVDYKNIYRTTAGGTDFYLAATIPNATTTFVDNISQSSLGEAMRQDCDIVPLGKYSAWWDDRLWVLDEDENIVYYSDTNRPEHFSIDSRFVSVRMGEQSDTGTGLIVYKGELYVFKRNSIYVIRKKSSGNYGRYEVCKDFGCVAPASLQETYGLLTFLSFRGWEVFNGCEGFSTLFSLPISKTLATLDKTKYALNISAHNKQFNEIWLTIADRSAGTEQVVVCNYLKGQCFFLFQFKKAPSWIGEARDSNGVLQLYMGTQDGFIYLCEGADVDGVGNNITATARTPWIKMPVKFIFDHFELEYELPSTYNLTVDFYIDQAETAFRQSVHAGATPSGSVDLDIRVPIKDQAEMFGNAQYIACKFTNAEAVGSALKLNSCTLFEQKKWREGKING
jgi:hypothetical protein